ncbi:MAG: hypothetical protein HQL24_10280 [Candidatus Omnitrophica bacterium]|nr:hypothetical protein [Candidatus Omnitrophota bacterium]
MDAANSVEIHRMSTGNTELPSKGSVETLHGRAEMPKRKSGQQVRKDGQGNLMLEAKLWVARSIRARDVNF